jgi:arsenate reductase-like glutaredoxin family protein
MENNRAQFVLVVHSEKSGDQSAIQYMKDIPGVNLEIIDLATAKITEGELASLVEKLGMRIEDLLDADYDDHISVHTEGLRLMDRQSLLTLMSEDTKLIATPIVISGDNAFLLGRDTSGDAEAAAFDMANFVLSTGMGRSRS